MAQTYKTFTVNTSDTVNTTYAVAHGLSKVPRIIIAWLNGRTTSGAAVGTYQRSYGVCTLAHGSPIVQMSVGSRSLDNSALTKADSAFQDDCIGCEVADSVTSGKIKVDTIDGTNVVFKLTQVFLTSSIVKVWLISGDDLTFINVAEYTGRTTNGTISYTTPGFKPDFLMVFGDHLAQGLPHAGDDSTLHFGVCDKNLNQWTWAGGVNDAGGGGGGGSGRAVSYQIDGQFVAVPSANAQQIQSQASVVSLDNTGFTLNFNISEVGMVTGRKLVILAVQGAQWAVGNFNTFADISSHTITNSLAFSPESVLFISANKARSTNAVFDTNEAWSFGIVSNVGPTNSVNFVGQKGIPWSSATTAYTDQDSALCYTNLDTTGARVGTAAATLIANGFSWQHADADPTAAFVGYVAYATQPQAGALTTQTITVKPNGGGDYTNLAAAVAGSLLQYKNLITRNIILKFACYAGIDTSSTTIPGWNNINGFGYMTTNTNHILIEAIDGHAGRIIADGTKYLLDTNANGGTETLHISNEFVRFKQLQIRVTKDDGGSTGGAFVIGTSGMVAPTQWEHINCILQTVLTNNSTCDTFHPPSSTFDVTGIKTYYINCIAYDVLSRDNIISGFPAPSGVVNQTITRYNCTAINCQQGFFERAHVKDVNCVAIGCDNGFNSSNGFDAGVDYCFSTNGPTFVQGTELAGTEATGNKDPQGAHSDGGLPVYLVDPIGGDFRPKAGVDLWLIGEAIDLSADATYPFNFDITGATRTGAWTRGAWHVATGAAVQAFKWAWCGAVESDEVTIAARYNQSETIKFQLDDDPAFASFTELSQAADADGFAKKTFTGLAANTVYYYRTAPNSAPTTYSPVGTFKTLPVAGLPASFNITFGACSHTGSNTNLWNAVAARTPIMHINLGDLHYWNIVDNDQAKFQQAFDCVHCAWKRERMWQTVPIAYVWDDHDYSGNNSGGTGPSKVSAEAAFRQAVPHYTLPSSIGQIYQSFIIGRVRFILTDLRSERSSNSAPDDTAKTLMGTEQKAWFKNEILTAFLANELVIWVSPVPFNDAFGTNNDTWGGFLTERQELIDYMVNAGMRNRVIIVCGDMHSAAIDDGTHTSGFLNMVPLPENQTGATYDGLYTQGPVEPAGQANRLMGNAGEIIIVDNGGDILNAQITLNIFNEVGTHMTYSKGVSYVPQFRTATGDWVITYRLLDSIL